MVAWETPRRDAGGIETLWIVLAVIGAACYAGGVIAYARSNPGTVIPWSKQPEGEKPWMAVLRGIGIVLVLLGVVMWAITRSATWEGPGLGWLAGLLIVAFLLPAAIVIMVVNSRISRNEKERHGRP